MSRLNTFGDKPVPLLPYCLFLGDVQAILPTAGVKGSAVHVLARGELTVTYSELEQTEFPAADFRQAALEFYEVVHTLFGEQAVIPFRFPTWLTAEKLIEHIEQQAEQYSKFLREHADEVQMEIRVSAESELPLTAASGTEYLRIRSAKAEQIRASADTLKAHVGEFVGDWRERQSPDGLRLCALVKRKGVADLREKLGRAEGQSLTWRLTGPWPATEFLSSLTRGGVQP